MNTSSKIDSKVERKTIGSLLLGVLSIGLFFITKPLIKIIAPIEEIGLLIYFSFRYIGFLIALIGLILGTLALKSTKRKLAIAGIVLNLIGLLVPLYYFLF